MATLTIRNAGDRLRCVMVEPLGEDFWIRSGETLVVTIPDNHAEIACSEAVTFVCVNVGDPYDVVVTTPTGEVVTCGYQRPADAVGGVDDPTPMSPGERWAGFVTGIAASVACVGVFALAARSTGHYGFLLAALLLAPFALWAAALLAWQRPRLRRYWAGLAAGAVLSVAAGIALPVVVLMRHGT